MANSRLHLSEAILSTIPPTKRKGLRPISDETGKFPNNNVCIITQCLDFPELERHTRQRRSVTKSDVIEEQNEIEEEEQEFDLSAPLLQDVIDLPINPNILHSLCFQENLIVSFKDEERKRMDPNSNVFKLKRRKLLLDIDSLHHVGGMSISIKKIDNYISISSASQFSCKGHNASNHIIAKTDHSLRMVVENRVETLNYNDIKLEKTLEIYSMNDSIVGIRTDLNQRHFNKYTTTIDLTNLGSLMLDGVGFLLVRYLVFINYVGKIETFSMYITGELCRSVYSFERKRKAIVNGYACNLIKVKRTIIHRYEEPEVSVSIFLESGHLLRQNWKDCPYMIHINPLLKMPPNIFCADVENQWREDLKLLQMFIDLKMKRLDEIDQLIGDQYEIKCCMKDYMMCLLQRKPPQVIEFTREYFLNMENEEGQNVVSFIDSLQK